MALEANKAEADALTREFAALEGVGLSEAIVIAMKEAIARRARAETPQQTAERLRQKYDLEVTERSRRALPRSAYEDLWEDA